MSYSLDYRKRVISFVKEGGSKREAARLFKISPNTVYEWLSRGEELLPRVAKSRIRKLDKAALLKHVKDHPDALLRERAVIFGVHPTAIFYALKRQKIVKKTGSLPRAMHYEKDGVPARAAPSSAGLRV